MNSDIGQIAQVLIVPQCPSSSSEKVKLFHAFPEQEHASYGTRQHLPMCSLQEHRRGSAVQFYLLSYLGCLYSAV